MREIKTRQLNENFFEVMKSEWALLTAGTLDKFNTMTIGWLTAGIIWGKDVITCYVRPSRYTYEFIQDNDLFTISFYYPQYCNLLSHLGTHSGRDEDKVKTVGFHPIELNHAVSFEEARMTIICKKIYDQAMDETQMQTFGIERYYPRGDYHRFYIGEIIKIYVKD